MDILFHLWAFENENIGEDGSISSEVSRFRADVMTQIKQLKKVTNTLEGVETRRAETVIAV